MPVQPCFCLHVKWVHGSCRLFNISVLRVLGILNDIVTFSMSLLCPFLLTNEFKKIVFIFLDEITLSRVEDGSASNSPVPLIKKGIAWESDKKYKFKNPEGNLQEGKMIVFILK